MTLNPTDPHDGDGTPSPEMRPADGIYDDQALRAEIARLIGEAPDRVVHDEFERQARIDAIRSKIEGGDYMSDEMIGKIVDRLLRKWNL